MAGQTLANYAALLKEYYTDEYIYDLGYKNNPWFSICPKFEKFYGDTLNVPTIYGYTTHSATFSTAQTNRGASKSAAFLLTRVSDYTVAEIGREVMLASENDKGAFMRTAKANVDGALHIISRSLSIAMYRSSTGSIGQISAGSNVATATITLTDINDVTNFEAGQVLTGHATDGATARTGTETIAGIDSDLGTLTSTSVAWNTVITALAASDFLCNSGDVNSKLSGLASWLPSSAPSATAFFGVDRTAHVTRLGGVRYDGSGVTIEEALVNGQSRVGRQGGKVDYCFLNNVQYRNLVNSLGSKVTYTDVSLGKVGFKALEIMGDAGPIKVMADPNCPSQVAYMLQSDTWKLYSLLAAPHIFDENTGQEMLRLGTSDSYELRCGYYAQLGCRAPGYNARVTLAAAT